MKFLKNCLPSILTPPLPRYPPTHRVWLLQKIEGGGEKKRKKWDTLVVSRVLEDLEGWQAANESFPDQSRRRLTHAAAAGGSC